MNFHHLSVPSLIIVKIKKFSQRLSLSQEHLRLAKRLSNFLEDLHCFHQLQLTSEIFSSPFSNIQGSCEHFISIILYHKTTFLRTIPKWVSQGHYSARGCFWIKKYAHNILASVRNSRMEEQSEDTDVRLTHSFLPLF